MLLNIEIIEELEKLDPPLRSSLIKIIKSLDKTIGEMVRREDFLDLKAELHELSKIVKELAESHKKSEERLTKLEQTVSELAESHKKSVERLTKLEQTVSELAESHKKSVERLTKLEQTVSELAESQKRTEEEVRKLAMELRETNKKLGNLSHTVGYGLEDKIIPYLPKMAKEEYGIKVKDYGRKNIVYPDGKYDEANLYVEGEKEGRPIYLIGECKAQLGKKDIDRFSKMLERIKHHLKSDVVGFIVSYSLQPSVEEYLKKSHPEIRFYYSYYFEVKYRS
jgi:DNA repair ATPase RecN